jgi:membrane protease YdiL (CAAX protease family)
LWTLLAACLLTPAVYSLLAAVLPEMPWPYSRVFDRVALVAAVVCLARRRADFDTAYLAQYWRELGSARAWRVLSLAALLTLGSTLAALPLVVAGGTLTWHPERTPLELVTKGLSYVPAALVIALIEESLFRLLLFEGLRGRLGTVPAALLSSLLYAFVHFLSPADYVYPGWSPGVGFSYLAAVADQFSGPGVPAGLVGLLLIGSTLCLAFVRGRSFAVCVGLHAGWVLGAKLALKIARRAPGFEFPSGAGRRNYLVTQPVAWLTIALVALAVWWVFHPRPAPGLLGVADAPEAAPPPDRDR